MALRIKEICKAKGMTMGQIAEKLGISPVNLSNSLNGNPTMNRLQEVADILGVEISELFESENRASICGHVEVDGVVYKIESVDSLRNLLNRIEQK